ncbi:hypothetical protein L873DRAFT_1800046 [Choiromyces venosus 120613-1]|uniref:UspA domain-containing protein n=1 Tax=Choiromyces venosus 120613-1 TaxID=1336337 RepID=A0A3N4KDR4_9PEZI|nr:hypothetical protein L873DRAFT_1800046 [Choiromyces venosus 120613-1]
MASLESALEEERLEILKLLERPAGKSSHQHPTGVHSTPSSPRAHFAPLLPPLNSRTSSPSRAPIISLIATAQDSPSAQTSTDLTGASSPRSSTGWNSNDTPHRNSMSSMNGVPKLLRDRDKPGILTPNDAYNFAILPSVPSPAPKRATQTAWNDPVPPSSHRSSFGAPGRRSLSPISNAALHHMQRSASPRSSSGRLTSPSPIVRNQISNQITNDAGVPIDLDHAYAKLSDDALARSGGVLGMLPERRPVTTFEGEYVRAGTGESLTSEGGVRLQKDYGHVDEHAVIDSSDEDETSSAEESVGSNSPVSEEEEKRGRAAARRNGSRSSSKNSTTGTEETVEKGPGMIKSMIRIVGDSGGSERKKKKGSGIDARKGTLSMRRTSMSLLAAAEEERKAVSSKYKVRSLLPSISITPSSNIPGATSPTTNRRPGVHPSTNFDLPSHNSTPMSSDTEADVRDLHRAQRMEMSFSPIISTPEAQRVVRTILRGEYDSIVKEAEEGNKRLRKYLVATDLSAEAQHALEWTIGTVLRDGDTLMAMYAIDQDTVEDGGKIVSDDGIAGELSSQAAAVGTSLAVMNMPHTPGTASPLSNIAIGDISERSRERTKAERERYVAAEAVTGLVEKLLKKTRLQVRVTVEVIHCKSPKHLLTEIIDFVEPTLVVLGSRGRSALKGVLLGSFSNYLVTKSSVPVMVARKKLKHTKKFAKTNVRQPNNLTTSAQAGRLAGAKVD